MRKGLMILIGLVLLSGLPAHAAGTDLSLTCITRDLPAGARVWLQVEPEHYQTPAPTPASLGEESSTPEPASGDSIWQFEVPASGSAPPSTHKFNLPTDLERTTSARSVSSIHLKIRFKVDAPGRQGAYGEVITATFGMPVLANNLPLSRCVRLREDSDKLILESAPDCSDSSFASFRRNGRILVRQPKPTPSSLGEGSSTLAAAGGDSISQFEVPASGSAPPSTQDFPCPTNLEPTSGKIVPSMRYGGGGSECPADVRGCSTGGGCCFICYLTLIACFGDPVTHEISCDCEYGDCYTNCL
jgi:hypothetical protein